MSQKIDSLLSFIRWKDWAPAKLPFLLSTCFYLALAEELYSPRFIRDWFLFALFLTVCSIYGYLVNDLSDVEIDRQQGKHNAFADWPRSRAVQLVIGLALLNALLALCFASRPWFLVLWLIWLVLTTIYSLPPVRLKERGTIGLVAPALAQQPFPVLFAFAIFGQLGGLDMWVFAAYPFAKGMALILAHQRLDLVGDQQSGTQTFAVQRGERKVTLAASLALELEKALLWGPLLLTVSVAPTWTVAGLSVNSALPLALGYLPVHLASMVEAWRSWHAGELCDPYHQGTIRNATGTACVVWPMMVFPFYLLILLTVAYPPNVLILSVFAALHIPYLFRAFRRLKQHPVWSQRVKR